MGYIKRNGLASGPLRSGDEAVDKAWVRFSAAVGDPVEPPAPAAEAREAPAAWQERQQITRAGEFGDWYACSSRSLSERSKVVGGIEYQWRPLYAAPSPAVQDVSEERRQALAAVVASIEGNETVPRSTIEHWRALVAPSPAVQGSAWISVEDRLPEKGVRVLVYVLDFPLLPIQTDEWNEQREDPTGMGGPSIVTGEGWDEHEFEEVSHWMPLPDPPALAASGAQPATKEPHEAAP